MRSKLPSGSRNSASSRVGLALDVMLLPQSRHDPLGRALAVIDQEDAAARALADRA